MKQLTRHTEVPRTSHKQLRERYPGYQVIGDGTGYSFPVHETKTVIVSCTFKTLIVAVKAHLKANDVPISPDLERNINEFACSEHPTMCIEVDPDAERKISLYYLAKRFFTAVISAATNGLVSQEEAERRAKICSQCPNNKPMEAQLCSGCWSAKFVGEAAEALSSKSTPYDNQLDTCSLCQCRLKMKIFVKKEAMQEKDIQWPDFCWMRPEN